MARAISYSAASLLFFSILASALEVSPDSPCASKCLDDPLKGNASMREDSLTFHQNLACFDEELSGDNKTDVGKKFTECQNCLKDSGYEDEVYGERDTQWFMFNNKAVVDWCIFGRFAEENNDQVSSTFPYRECNTACQAIYQSIDYKIKSDTLSYSFCDYQGNFSTEADACTSCLYNSTGLTILGNVLVTVQELCNQKPLKSFAFDADIYTASRIELASATTPGASSTAPPSSQTVASTTNAGSDSGLSKGAIAGIVLGALVAIAVILGGILLVLRRIRKSREIIEMPRELHGNGLPVETTGDTYDPVKQTYAYQNGGSPVGPAELGTQHPVNELPGQLPSSPVRR